MKIGVLKETVSGESRVAATPETVKKMITLNHSVSIEAGAGTQASISDEDYKKKLALKLFQEIKRSNQTYC